MSTQVRAQITERRRVRSKMAAAKLSTIEVQLNQPDSTLKFRMGGGGEDWGDIPSNNDLYVGTVPSNNVLYVGTVPSKNHFGTVIC